MLKKILTGEVDLLSLIIGETTPEKKAIKRKNKNKKAYLLACEYYNAGLTEEKPTMREYNVSELDFTTKKIQQQEKVYENIFLATQVEEEKAKLKGKLKQHRPKTVEVEEVEEAIIEEYEPRKKSESKKTYVPKKRAIKKGEKVSISSALQIEIEDTLGAYAKEIIPSGKASTGGGHRRATYSVPLQKGTSGKAKRKLSDIEVEISSGDNIGSVKATIAQGGFLQITITFNKFDPIYTENCLHLLKKSGDYVVGEILNEKGQSDILIRNIFETSPNHLASSGGTGSGKSFLQNAIAQSLLHSTPEGSFYMISPKSDAKGGDFSAFEPYPQVKECHIIKDTSNAQIELLEKTMEISEMLLQLINKGGDGNPHFFFIDELAYLLDVKNKPTRPREDSEEWEIMEYELYSLKKRVLHNIKTIAQLGRSPRVILILGTQLFSAMSFDSQLLSNLNRMSLKMENGFGASTPFNSDAEDLLPLGDGLVSVNGNTVGFQATLATP